MLRVNALARIIGVHLAAMQWKGSASGVWHYTQKDLDEVIGREGRPDNGFDINLVNPSIRPYVQKQLKFSEKFRKPEDRIFGSDIILAYEWYVSTFRALEFLRGSGIAATDIGFDVDKWNDYLGGEWACPEELQTCINIAAEMGTKEGFLVVYRKLLKAFSLKHTIGFVPDYWKATIDLPVALGEVMEEKVDPAPTYEKPQKVTCCFTVTREVAEWLKAKPNMSRFIMDLVEEEMSNEG